MYMMRVLVLYLVLSSVVRNLQSGDFVSVHAALLPVGMLDVRRVSAQWSVCALTAVWGSVWTSGGQCPQSVRHFRFAFLSPP